MFSPDVQSRRLMEFKPCLVSIPSKPDTLESCWAHLLCEEVVLSAVPLTDRGRGWIVITLAFWAPSRSSQLCNCRNVTWLILGALKPKLGISWVSRKACSLPETGDEPQLAFRHRGFEQNATAWALRSKAGLRTQGGLNQRGAAQTRDKTIACAEGFKLRLTSHLARPQLWSKSLQEVVLRPFRRMKPRQGCETETRSLGSDSTLGPIKSVEPGPLSPRSGSSPAAWAEPAPDCRN